jgi:glucosamine-phosphate N-acetyltransferase
MEEYIIRESSFDDLDDIINIIGSEFSETQANQRKWWSMKSDRKIKVYVYEYKGYVRGVASLYILEKLMHNGSNVGLIEDVAVASNSQGMGIGRLLINKLVEIAKEERCYKVILNCSDKNVGFYEKCGFSQREVQMRIDID